MNGVNKVIIVGSLGADPETRYTAAGGAVTNIRVATTEKWKDKESGETKESTEWHRIVFFGRQAEVAGQYLKKGSPVYVEGKLKTRKWEDKDGATRYTTEIVADNLQLLGRGTGSDDPAQEAAPANAAPPAVKRAGPAVQTPSRQGSKLPAGIGDMDDDIPF